MKKIMKISKYLDEKENLDLPTIAKSVKMHRLKKEIKGGCYKCDPQKTARFIIEEATGQIVENERN